MPWLEGDYRVVDEDDHGPRTVTVEFADNPGMEKLIGEAIFDAVYRGLAEREDDERV